MRSNIATQESWKNDKGDYETRTEWHRVYAWGNLVPYGIARSKMRWKALGSNIGSRRSTPFSMKRLSRVEAADDPADGAGDE
jgi:single-strand DNA-binding protein